MGWNTWDEMMRQTPEKAVADLLRGAADISPYERASPHEFLLSLLPRSSRTVTRRLLGEPSATGPEPDPMADLPGLLDQGLASWLLTQRQLPSPPPHKLISYAAQIHEALQLPLYFIMPLSNKVLQTEGPWLTAFIQTTKGFN